MPLAARCRLVLMAGADIDPDRLAAALDGGDVASVIISPFVEIGAESPSDVKRLEEAAFGKRAEALVLLVQQAGAAAVVAFETRIASRVGADGIQLERPVDADEIERLAQRMSVGIGNLTDRHGALAMGELQIDYAFFGRLHRDIRPEPHARNLKLARWWSEIVALPCVVSGGNVVESVVDVADAGADFVALQSAIFDDRDPARAVARANALLNENAPRFEI